MSEDGRTECLVTLPDRSVGRGLHRLDGSALHRVIAQIDVSFSNSLIEA
jgi:hypothetical protein